MVCLEGEAMMWYKQTNLKITSEALGGIKKLDFGAISSI